jgi:hypothetical protein
MPFRAPTTNKPRASHEQATTKKSRIGKREKGNGPAAYAAGPIGFKLDVPSRAADQFCIAN